MAETAWSGWTTATLAAHVNAAINTDDNAAGTATTKSLREIRNAGIELWNTRDWIFRRKQGSMTTAAGTHTYDAPTDFAKFDQRWLRDYDETITKLRFSMDPTEYQRVADLIDLTDSGDYSAPEILTCVRDTAESAWAWHFMLAPTPDDAYTYAYWYVIADPWTTGSLADSASPVWPPTFHLGWELLARYKVLMAFSRNEDAIDSARQRWREWLSQQIAENNETIASGGDLIIDGYQDHQLFGSVWPHNRFTS